MSIEEMTKMAKHLAEVRTTGVTNMFDRPQVVEVLQLIGYEATAEYIKNNRADYLKILMLSGDF